MVFAEGVLGTYIEGCSEGAKNGDRILLSDGEGGILNGVENPLPPRP